jgi:PAS domain S-box-containing protein
MTSAGRLRLRILAIGGAVIVAFVSEAGYDSWRLHQQIMNANTRELVNLARSLANEAERTLQAVDTLVSDTAARAANDGLGGRAATIDAMLAMRVKHLPQIVSLAIADEDGRVAQRTPSSADAPTGIENESWFTAQRDRKVPGLFVSTLAHDPDASAPALVLSRRFEEPDGRFAGIVEATVTLQQLRDAYQTIDLGKNSALLLSLADGTLVIRQPAMRGIEGRLKMAELVAMRAGPPIAVVMSRLDGRRKLIATAEVGGWPLIIALQRDEATALQPWFDEVRSTLIRTLLATLVTGLVTWGVLRQLKRIETAAEALRRSESRYAMTMEAASEGHAEWNLRDDSVFLSPKWRGLHGVDSTAAVQTAGKVRQAVDVHPDDVAVLIAAVETHLADRASAIEVDYRVRHGTGWCWIHARGRCLRDHDGAPLSLFCSAIDVTERKRDEAEKAAFELRQEQTRRMEALGTLAGGIAHDFNNILGAIIGYGEMAQGQSQDGTPLRRNLDRVMQAGARARMLVRRILDFSRSGVAERALVNVQGVVEEVVALFAPSLPSGVSVDVQLTTGDMAVLGDATQLFQVVMNLCTNAVQAIGEEGRIGIGLVAVELAGPVSMLRGGLAPGSYVRLDVEDSGPGIPAEVLGRVFEPFYTTKKGGEGTGLGLSVVHGIVAGLGGAIDVASCDPCGTRFSVWLPSAGGVELGHRSGRTAAALPGGNGETVMVVDDEEALVQLAEEILAGIGYEPVGYSSAEAALAAFESCPSRFDALLTDHMLPGMLGGELARRVLEMRPELPVLVMSGNLGDVLEGELTLSGVRAVLHKPLTPRDLAEHLASLFVH